MEDSKKKFSSVIIQTGRVADGVIERVEMYGPGCGRINLAKSMGAMLIFEIDDSLPHLALFYKMALNDKPAPFGRQYGRGELTPAQVKLQDGLIEKYKKLVR